MRLAWCLVLVAGQVFAEGQPTPPKPTPQSLDAAKRGCDKGDAKACTRVGVLRIQAHYSGASTDRDGEIALDYYQRGCDLHDVAGCTGVAWVLLEGLTTGKPDYKRALPILEDACRAKHMPACTMLADELDPVNGIARAAGVPADVERAIALDRAACEVATDEACSSGCDSMATRYFYGSHVEKDHALAAQFFDKACKVGCFNSCHSFGDIARDGDGMAKDPKRACRLSRNQVEGC
jgi:TPR repeat protein